MGRLDGDRANGINIGSGKDWEQGFRKGKARWRHSTNLTRTPSYQHNSDRSYITIYACFSHACRVGNYVRLLLVSGHPNTSTSAKDELLIQDSAPRGIRRGIMAKTLDRPDTNKETDERRQRQDRLENKVDDRQVKVHTSRV